jgi:hypothetical protein
MPGNASTINTALITKQNDIIEVRKDRYAGCEKGSEWGWGEGPYIFDSGDIFGPFKVLGSSVSRPFTHIVDEIFGYFA